MGAENDGIAVGMMDVLEPAYFSQMNTTDSFLYENQWLPPADVPAGVDATPDSLNYLVMCFNKQKVAMLRDEETLAPAAFARVAIITDTDLPLYIGTIVQFSQDSSNTKKISNLGPESSTNVRQSDKDNGGNYDLEPMYFGRGTILGFAHAFAFHYYPDYDLTGTHYYEMWNLTPTLGGANPGIPTPIKANFTSSIDDDCAQYYPGAWPGGYIGGYRISRHTWPAMESSHGLKGAMRDAGE